MLSASRDAGIGVRRILFSKFGSKLVIRPIPVCIVFCQQKRGMVTEGLVQTDTLGRWTGQRDSVSGIVATVFGASGLVGPHVVSRLARIGSHVIIPYRDDGWNVRELKCMGALGKVNLLPLDMTDESTIRRAVAKSNVVINLIGSEMASRNYSVSDTNIKCTYRIAKIAAEAGNVERFIHLSAEGADVNSEDEFYSSKAQGEEWVRHFFPNATIMRPNVIFGVQDTFIDRIGHLANYSPLIPTYRDGKQKLKPIWVNDVAQCIVNALYDYRSQGQTYHIAGPEIITQKEVTQFVVDFILQGSHIHFDLGIGWKKKAWDLFYKIMFPIWTRVFSRNLLIKFFKNDLLPPESGALTEADLGVVPHTLSDKGRYVLEKHRGERKKSYQEEYGVEHSRMYRNPSRQHPNVDASEPVSRYGENYNNYDGVMPDGSRLPGGVFDWQAWQKKHPVDEYVKRM